MWQLVLEIEYMRFPTVDASSARSGQTYLSSKENDLPPRISSEVIYKTCGIKGNFKSPREKIIRWVLLNVLTIGASTP
jgi:hypothetical protein